MTFKSSLHEYVDTYKNIPNARYYIDMDGVLCDFVRAVVELHGAEVTADMYKSIEHHDLYGPNQSPLVPSKNADEFWKPIAEKGADFWRTIPSFHCKHDIQGLFAQLPVERTFILTSPSRNAGCRLGKLQWIADMGIEASVIFEKRKWSYARSSTDILLDDHPSNITRWRTAGGTAMCYRQPWNKHVDVHAECTSISNVIADVFQKYDSSMFKLS